jgi:hypothetical protein
MSVDTSADQRLAGQRSLHLLLLLFAVILSTVFGGELLVMYLLERMLPADSGEWTAILLDAGLLSAIVTAVVLPFMLHLRRLHLRQARNTPAPAIHARPTRHRQHHRHQRPHQLCQRPLLRNQRLYPG